MIRGADISADGLYRWRLTRIWDSDVPILTIVMLNPSTADGEEDDPTIRRCMSFAKSWGYGGIIVVNLFAFRATNPTALQNNPHVHSTENFRWIREACGGNNVLVAWGSWGYRFGTHASAVMAVVREVAKSVVGLGTTKDGHPRHPLYVAGDTPRLPYPAGP